MLFAVCALVGALAFDGVATGTVELDAVAGDRARLIDEYRALATRVRALPDLSAGERSAREAELRAAFEGLIARWCACGLDREVVPTWDSNGVDRLVLGPSGRGRNGR